MRLSVATAMAAIMSLTGTAAGLDAPTTLPKDKKAYSAYARRDFPNQVLFGDTHLHTAYSPDAGMAGRPSRPRTRIVSPRARPSDPPRALKLVWAARSTGSP